MGLVAIVPRIPPPIVTLMLWLISTSLQCDGMGGFHDFGGERPQPWRCAVSSPIRASSRDISSHNSSPTSPNTGSATQQWLGVTTRRGLPTPSLPMVRRSTVRSARATLHSSSRPSDRMRSFFRRESSAVMSSPSRTTWHSARAPLLRRAAVRLFSQPRS